MRGKKNNDLHAEFQRVRIEITDSEEEIRRLRMSGLLHLSDADALDQLEDELREFERVTEYLPKEDTLHSLHNQLHDLRSRIDSFSNEVRMI